MSNPPTPPSDEWTPLFRTSPFLDLIGPLFQRPNDNGDGGFAIGLRIKEELCNARQGAHGGVLATLADISLGYVSSSSVEPAAALTTANLSLDYAGTVKLGDWLESHVDVQRVGGRAAFANCFLMVGDKRMARASAVFIRSGDV